MKGHALLWVALFLPSLALAQEEAAAPLEGTLDAYYLPRANIEVRQRAPAIRADESGTGFGAKAFVHLTDMLMATGEYQSVSYDNIQGADRDEFRVGGGIGYPSGTGLFVEGISTELGDGFGAHFRGAGTVGERIALYGQAGYVQVEDDERAGGFEFSLGGSYAILNLLQGTVGGFLDYRVTSLEGAESQVEEKLRDFRVGVRYTFGGAAAMPEPADEGVGVEPVSDEGTAEPAAEEPAPAEEVPAGESPAEEPAQ